MKSLWDFLAQNHKGMINSTRWWAVFVEGAGNEEQPTDTHPEISKCTVMRRNDLSVSHHSPCRRLNTSFESCCQKALRHQKEAKRHLQLLVIKSYPKATKPISLSKILHHPHKPHPPPQYSHNIQKSFAEPSRGRQQWPGEGWSSRATYCLARMLSALSSWLSQRIGGNFTN